MKANELRLGNLLKRGGVVVTIDARSIFDFSSFDYQYEPILLTREWLERFGFEQTFECGDDEIMSQFGRVKLSKKKLIKGEYWSYPRQNKGVWTAIEYVHQLQNLFFCLCGEELTTVSQEPAQRQGKSGLKP